MPGAGTLLDYGIAVNFFGNYRREASTLDGITGKLSNSLLSLQRMVIGGGLVYALGKLSGSLLNVAMSMEQNFANLKSTLGSAEKAISTLDWARKKGAETPFEIGEVNDAVSLMTTMGFNKNDKMREEVFKSIGDFAGLRGAGFADMMQRVAKASFGNWESLGDTYGIRRQTVGGMVRTQMSRTPEKYKGEEDSINKAIQMVEKGKKGTEEYKMAIVKLIGVLGRGGMVNRLNTIGGAWSNVNDLVQNFMFKMVGYSQIQGTLANTIKNTIVEKILNPFMNAHTVVINGIEEQVTAVDQLGNIGKGVGDMLIEVWGMFDTQIGNASNSIVDWIDKLDAWFRNYKENVAPTILFLALVRIQVEEFLKGFYDGFVFTFGFFLKAGAGVWSMLAKIADWMGITKGQADSLGTVLGVVLGTLLGIKAFRLMTFPLKPLINGSKVAFGWLSKVFMKQRAVLMADGVMTTSTGLFKQLSTTLRYLMFPLQGAAIASWSFTASLLANPITWIVVAVIALVGWLAYLIYNWEEVGNKMQGVSDTALTLLSVFAPIIGIPLLMAKHWDKFKTIFINIWRVIKSSFNIVAMFMGDKINTYLINPIRSLVGWFKNFWANIETNYPKVAGFLKTLFAPIQMIIDGFRWLIDNGGNFLDSILGSIGDWTGGVADWFEDAEEKTKNYYDAKNSSDGNNEDVYKTIGANSSNNNSQTKIDNSLSIPGGITIVQQPGQDGEALSNDFIQGLQNNLAKKGK